jgi:5-hydroxyisourate hydrolase
MSKITTHVLDTSKGKPAQGIGVILEQLVDGNWKEIAKGITNSDGRIPDLTDQVKLEAALYRLSFNVEGYFAQRESFYPYVPIVFEITQPEQHYHVPLLLSPFGYSTYRGS